ncbi:hypothetical protein diail_3289 [Diaporthe ilicicola]|nr:hypothetical protein diail_3289 [Diaporthe ilicicola]
MAKNVASAKRKEPDEGIPNEGNPSDSKRAKVDGTQPLTLSERAEAVKCQMDELLQAAQQQASDATLKYEGRLGELDDLKTKLKAAESRLDELMREKLASFALTGPQGPEDGEVEIAFSQLTYALDTFVGEFFSGDEYVRKDCENRAPRDFFKKLVSDRNYEAYVKGEASQSKEMFIRAVIWNRLIDALLNIPNKAFFGMPDAIKADTLHTPKLAAFHALRAEISRLLFENPEGCHPWGANGHQRHQFIKETAELLRLYSDCKSKGRQRTIEMKSRLGEVVDNAFTLTSAMARSRAYWICSTRDIHTNKIHGFEVDTKHMVEVNLWECDHGDGDNGTVDLVAAPMLLKFGNSSGVDYGKCRVAKKATVITAVDP